MTRRLYLGRLPQNARSEDISTFFSEAGPVVEVRVMNGFGFIEFENSTDAESAVTKFNGKSFMGENALLVEFAKESRPRREREYPDHDRRESSARSRRPTGIRIIVSGISRDTSWQDLKDFGRESGSVSFADIDRDVSGQGILEYLSREDADRAIKDLDGKDLRGRTVHVSFDERGGADNFRRDDRRDDRRDHREDRYRRDRSRSPRRDYDDSRRRSPPGRRGGDYEDRRDDRRNGDYDRRRDDRGGRDDRRHDREPREDREERSSKHGDGGWSR